MPIYEYECSACHHALEALQKMNDAPLLDCPECREASLVKKISAVAFRLSGSGWYETDFKSGNKKNLAGDSKADSGGKESKESKVSTDKTPAKSSPGTTDKSSSASKNSSASGAKSK